MFPPSVNGRDEYSNFYVTREQRTQGAEMKFFLSFPPPLLLNCVW
jgi:hypothetical protein